MQSIAEKMSREEKLSMQLRALYRSYGYKYYRMSSFEPYDLYRENKNFLVNQSVLTFTDLDGRLMALKPDITIGIAKNTGAEEKVKKLFYSEHVFRKLPGASQFTEIKQMGLEYIGGGSGYPEAEVLTLAARTLAAICDDYSLEVNHMGYISACLEQMELPGDKQEELLAALARKSAVDMQLILADAHLTPAQMGVVTALTGLPADPYAALDMLNGVCLNKAMTAAINELRVLLDAAAVCGFADKLRIEPSLLNDQEYYNGLVFQGYIKGLPHAVLSGGRYDKLLQRFDKQQPALGFALYFNELQNAPNSSDPFDVDVLLLYDSEAPALVSRAASDLIEQGQTILVEKDIPEGIRAKSVCRVSEMLKAKEDE